MKLETPEEKLAFIAGYLEAVARRHAEEFDRDVGEVKEELLDGMLSKAKGARA